MNALVERKLTDLRVVELKSELEKRGLDKTGVKALLVGRLQEALINEGSDPDSFLFEVAEYSPKKMPRKSREDVEKTPEEDEEEEEETVIDNPECFGELIEESEYQVAEVAGQDIPNPDSVEEPKCLVTVEETIAHYENGPGDFENSESMIVHVDETEVVDELIDGLSCEGVDEECATVDSEHLPATLTTQDECCADDVVQEETVPTSDVVVVDSGDEPSNTNLDDTIPSQSQHAVVVESGKENQRASSTPAAADEEAGKEVASTQAANGDPSDATATGPSTKPAPRRLTNASAIAMLTGMGNPNIKVTGTSLWVSGIPPKSRAADVKEVFSKVGRVQLAKIVTCAKMPGSRCFGFVTMVTAEEADLCVSKLSGTDMNGRKITVERAKSDNLITSKVNKTGAQNQPTKKSPITAPATDGQLLDRSNESAEVLIEPPFAIVSENGKDKRDGSQQSKEASKAREKKRSTSDGRDSRHRRRSRSRSPTRRHRNDRESGGFRGGFRSRPSPMRGMGAFRRPIGRGGGAIGAGSYGMRRPMRGGGFGSRFGNQTGSRFYDDRRDVEYERMRIREKEQMQREEMLRIDREKARLRADRERLEREKLELQQQRMRIGYEGGVGAMQSGGGGGMKRMYETGPYPPAKRMAYPNAATEFDNRIPQQPRDRVSGGFRRPEYDDGRDVRRTPNDRYDYRGPRAYNNRSAAPGDHRSGQKVSPFGGGGMNRSDTRRISPPSSMSRRGRPSGAWADNGGNRSAGGFGAGGGGGRNSGGFGTGGNRSSGGFGTSGNRSAGGFGAHSAGGGGGGNASWMSGVDRSNSGGATAGGGSWGRGPGNTNSGNTWGFGAGSNQFGGGGNAGADRFDSYGKYSGSINRRY